MVRPSRLNRVELDFLRERIAQQQREIAELQDEVEYLNLLLSVTLAQGRLTRDHFVSAMRLFDKMKPPGGDPAASTQRNSTSDTSTDD